MDGGKKKADRKISGSNKKERCKEKDAIGALRRIRSFSGGDEIHKMRVSPIVCPN